MARESTEVDVLIVGGGPAGLAAAIRIGQLTGNQERPLSVCLLEKGVEIGSHLLSGAIVDTRALDELIPDWVQRPNPLADPVSDESFYYLVSDTSAIRIPGPFIPRSMRNRGCRTASLGKLCRWLADEARELGVTLYTGFPASALLIDDRGSVCGVSTADMGLDTNGRHKPGYAEGMDIHAAYVILAEGSRGHLGRDLIDRFGLARLSDPQHYAIGLKERWQVRPGRQVPGKLIHTTGWPLQADGNGGAFLYHMPDNEVMAGMIVDLDYPNPYLDPFREFQRIKHHPLFAHVLNGGERTGYGARSISKGGYYSLPRMTAPGALLTGCDAGTLDPARLKGIHTAMKSGMIAAETVFRQLQEDGRAGLDLVDFERAFRQSWAGNQLQAGRNFGPALSRFGSLRGGIYNLVEQTLFRGHGPFQIRNRTADHLCTRDTGAARFIDYPAPDNRLSFDKASSVFLSDITHDPDQPNHLKLEDESRPVGVNLEHYAGLESRFCPAGVYEYVNNGGEYRFQVNAQNCIHCKTCDIKEPALNIRWTPPEAGSGPNYSGM